MRTFQDVIDVLPEYMNTLTHCRPMRMNTRAERVELGRRLEGLSGIYVLYEGNRPMYVGRSANLKERVSEHGRAGAKENATLAFNLTRDSSPEFRLGTREGLWFDSRFERQFKLEIERVKQMIVRVVEVTDSIEQTVFEVYAAMTLDTPYNTFDTH